MAAPDLLPGPTGEHNEIQLHGRGVVLCVIGERASLALALAQVGAALGAGNTVVAAAGPALAAALSRLAPVLAEGAAGAGGGPGVATVVAGAAEPAVEEAATDRRVAIVALCGGEAQRGRLAAVLASRPGPLVPLIDEPFGPRLLDRFVVERTLTIDRTAAGGNATLLTLAEDAADRTPG
jgi:RHH-type proline utilization regulon transcriptional repressor/proline dehydrogenase/delta 1-pyrroline-5-carboxylate dehydrogenase